MKGSKCKIVSCKVFEKAANLGLNEMISKQRKRFALTNLVMKVFIGLLLLRFLFPTDMLGLFFGSVRVDLLRLLVGRRSSLLLLIMNLLLLLLTLMSLGGVEAAGAFHPFGLPGGLKRINR